MAFASLGHVLGCSRADTVLKYPEEIEEKTLAAILGILDKLRQDMPFQYITGAANFCGFPIMVNPSVLIPRPETEELTGWIIKENRNRDITILDIGTGSGCIAIALKKNISSGAVFALDISENALTVAGENAKQNNVEINFRQYDILKNNNENTFPLFDIIVSNPPYVKESEKASIKKNVLCYEPSEALFVDDANPLIYYSAVADFSLKKLKPSGALYFEINENCGEPLSALLKEKGFSGIIIKKDINNKNRMLKCLQPG